MFIPFKDDDGSYGVRPMYIGFIKNNLVRRTSMILLWPLTLTVYEGVQSSKWEDCPPEGVE